MFTVELTLHHGKEVRHLVREVSAKEYRALKTLHGYDNVKLIVPDAPALELLINTASNNLNIM